MKHNNFKSFVSFNLLVSKKVFIYNKTVSHFLSNYIINLFNLSYKLLLIYDET